jgi:hypothetical protein
MITDFQVESLGIESSAYFGGYGLGPSSKYGHFAYGIGDTEADALDDCLEMMAQQTDALDEATEARIRAAFGPCKTETVADALGLPEDDQQEVEDSGDDCWFHVGIKWNEE